jgi:hypothetical protein
MCLGAIFDTKDNPNGLINSAATVKKKYIIINVHGIIFNEVCCTMSIP